MKIAVVGLGFVGLVTSTILAQFNEIIGIDVDKEKISKLNNNELYIYEPGLKDLFTNNRNNLHFYSDYKNAKDAEIAFICVPTPTVNDKIDIEYVEKSVMSLAEINKSIIIVIKSTVVPGTARNLSQKLGIHIVSNPEFLREGSAIIDTTNPDRIIVGGDKYEVLRKISKIWSFTGAPTLETTNENAELIKYASNSFLAVKISFINEIADLCQEIPNTDVDVVARGMGMDHRIGVDFLRAGLGFGGSCFPKDTRAILTFSQNKGVPLSIVKDAIDVNNGRIKKSIKLIEKAIGSLEAKRILLLGLSFKNDTNDLRESKSVELANELIQRKAIVYAYDPLIKEYPGIRMVKELNSGSYDCVVISSEWKEFKNNDIYKRNKSVVDLRRIVDINSYTNVKAIGIYYD